MDDVDAAVSQSLLGAPLPAMPALPATPAADPAAAARFGMQQAVGTNPDLEAELQRVAAKTGVPISTARAQPEEVKRQAALGSIDFDALATVAPSTARLLGDMDAAKVSHDDVGTLTAIEQGVRSFMTRDAGKTYLGASLVAGLQDTVGVAAKLLDAFNPFTTSQGDAAVLFKNDPAGLQRFNQGPASLLGRVQSAMSQASDATMADISPEAKAAYGSLEYATTDFGKAAYLSPVKVIGDAIRSLPTSLAMGLSVYLTRGAATQAEAQALAAGLSPQLARQAAVQAGAKTMAQVGAASEGTVGYAQQQGQTAATLDKLSPEDMAKSPQYQELIAQGYAPEAARQATIAATSEQAGTVAGIVDAAVNHVGGALLGKILTEGGKLLPRVGKGALTEGITEFLQSGGEQLGENVAMRRNVDPTQDLTKDVFENMVQGLAVGGLSGGAFAGFGGHAHDEAAAHQAVQHAQVLGDIMQAAAASKVRERSADTFEGFMQSATEDGPLEKLYVNPAEMQKAGIDLTTLAEVAPSVMPQIQHALETGTDVGIPTSELTTRLPGSTLEQSLLQHLKTDPGGFSQVGANEYLQTQGETQRAEVEKVLAEHAGDTSFKDSMHAVEQNVTQQLHEANRFTDDVNAPYAALWSSFFGVQAARLGVMPKELFDRFAPRIVAHMPEGKVGVLEQDARGSFDPQTNTVALLKAADLSTFLHESGHFFLEVMHGLSTQQDAPAALRADFDTFLRWTGVGQEPPAAAGEGAPLEQALRGAEGAAGGEEQAPAPAERLSREEQAARRLALWNAMTIDEKRAHHEDFARGFEAYLFEGKAPSIEMQGVFQRFRAWLLNVYRSIAGLNINLNAEIRGVFDRMLATTEQIKLAEDVRGYEALFKNKPEGMTDDEWAVYQVQANDATQQAITDLESRSLSDMKWLTNAKSRELKKLQAQAKARRDEIEAEVRKELEAQPVYQAIAAIREIRRSDPQDREAAAAWKVQRDAEEERLTAVVKNEHLNTPEGQAATGIRRGQFLARNKRLMANEVQRLVLQWEQNNPRPKVAIPEADLNAVAALHGFTSGDELQKAIDAAPPLKEAVEAATDQRMLERHADLADPATFERAAEEAIHNDARLRFTATETNALRKAIGQPALLAKAVRQFAADIIARTKVRDLKPAVYTSAERRAALDAEKAQKAGKLEDAAIQKRNQLINGHAAKAAMQAQDEAQKIVAYLRGFDKPGAATRIDADYLDQIHAMLERFELRQVSNKELGRRQSLAAWIESQKRAGLEPDIPPDIAEEANRVNFKSLTMEQLRGLRDSIQQIDHLGRFKKKLLTAKDQRDYEAARDEIVASIVEHAGDRTATNRTRPTTLDATIRMWNGYLLEHRKVASLVREMDGFQDGGVLWEYFMRPLNEAGNKEATMRADAADKLAALVKPLRAIDKLGARQFIEGAATAEDRKHGKTGSSFTREERIGIALNMGNAGNIQRLLGGEGWTMQNVKAIVDTLTTEEWHFVQKVWDFLEGYRPEIAAKERRLYGKEPDWVEPQRLTVQTADGETITLAGGYYPVRYDTALSTRALENNDAEAAAQQMRGAYTSSTTRRSFTKARADEVTGRPLLYSMDALFNGVNEVIHDLSYHEWLIDANRLLRSESITNAIRDKYGAQVVDQLKSAVKDIAAGEFPATHAFERMLGGLRAGAVVAGLGLNIMNSIINVQGITQSMARIGPKWVGIGISKYAQNPIALSREVAARSDLMANRAKTMNREINEIQSIVRDKSRIREVADRITFLPLTMTQQMVDLPTWWGAYQKALDEGNADDRSVALADQAVLDSQSGGQIKDLAKIQRGGTFLKLMTTFYGFFNSTYNLSVEATKATNFSDPVQVVGLAGKYMLLWMIPALMGTLLKNLLTGADWDPDKLAKKAIGDQIAYMMGMMVGLRDIAGAAQTVTGTNEFTTGYAGPSGGRFFGEVYKLAMQVHQGDVDMPLIKALDNVVGILFKLPSGQINRTVEGIAALNAGETSNPLAIIAGPPPKH